MAIRNHSFQLFDFKSFKIQPQLQEVLLFSFPFLSCTTTCFSTRGLDQLCLSSSLIDFCRGFVPFVDGCQFLGALPTSRCSWSLHFRFLHHRRIRPSSPTRAVTQYSFTLSSYLRGSQSVSCGSLFGYTFRFPLQGITSLPSITYGVLLTTGAHPHQLPLMSLWTLSWFLFLLGPVLGSQTLSRTFWAHRSLIFLRTLSSSRVTTHPVTLFAPIRVSSKFSPLCVHAVYVSVPIPQADRCVVQILSKPLVTWSSYLSFLECVSRSLPWIRSGFSTCTALNEVALMFSDSTSLGFCLSLWVELVGVGCLLVVFAPWSSFASVRLFLWLWWFVVVSRFPFLTFAPFVNFGIPTVRIQCSCVGLMAILNQSKGYDDDSNDNGTIKWLERACWVVFPRNNCSEALALHWIRNRASSCTYLSLCPRRHFNCPRRIIISFGTRSHLKFGPPRHRLLGSVTHASSLALVTFQDPLASQSIPAVFYLCYTSSGPGRFPSTGKHFRSFDIGAGTHHCFSLPLVPSFAQFTVNLDADLANQIKRFKLALLARCAQTQSYGQCAVHQIMRWTRNEEKHLTTHRLLLAWIHKFRSLESSDSEQHNEVRETKRVANRPRKPGQKTTTNTWRRSWQVP